MRMAPGVQRDEQPEDLGVDPGVGALLGGLGAAGEGAGEVEVAGHLELPPQHRPAEAARDVEAVQRDDAAVVGIDEEQARIVAALGHRERSEEHTSELQSLMRISYAVFCLKKKTKVHNAI